MDLGDAVIEFMQPAVGNFLGKVLEKRRRFVREVLSAELRKGNFERVNEDDILYIAYRVNIDVMEGIAKKNLRLLAKMICGLNNAQILNINNFKKYEKVLVDLTEDELLILSKIIKHYLLEPDSLKCSCVDKALVDICGLPKEKECDVNKYHQCLEILSALERTGLIIKTGKTPKTYHTGSLYHSPYHITNLMKDLMIYCPNWEDIASDSLYE